MKLKKRFEKMEIPDGSVPQKKSILEKMGYKRKLELGNEAQAERISQDMRRISDELMKQVDANENKRELEIRMEAAKKIERRQKEEFADLKFQELIIKERKENVRQKFFVGLVGVGIFIVFVLFGPIVESRGFFDPLFAVDGIIFGIVLAAISYFFRSR